MVGHSVEEPVMSEGERIEPRTGAKRRERRDDEANFGEADDQGRSLV